MRRKKTAAAAALLGAIAEAEAKTTAQGEEDLNALKDLLKQFLQKDASPERAALKREYDLGCPLTGPGGLRRKLGAIDMEFFGRAYFPHYFSRPSPEFHRELDNI